MTEPISSFDRLIFPVKAPDFFSETWEKQPLSILRKTPDYYSSLFSIQSLESLITLDQSNKLRIGIFKDSNPDLSYYFQLHNNFKLSFKINHVYDAYSNGYTIRLDDLDASCEPVAVLCRNLEETFSFRVNANAYLTPKDSQGIIPHFDTSDNFILQIVGSKHWRIYNPFVRFPLDEDQQLVPRAMISDPIHEICLTAGDLLYIPRGYVHEALTSDQSSLHLTVGVYPLRLTDLISKSLALVSQQHESFRKSLPVGFLKQEEIALSLRHQFEELLALFQNNADLEGTVKALTRGFLGQTKLIPDGQFMQIDALDKIDLNTTVRRRNNIPCQIYTKNDFVYIQFPGRIVKVPSHLESSLWFIHDSQEFMVNAIPDMQDSEKLVLVRRFVKEGLLKVV